ncbi:MAG: homocysteine S-methyltransferase family protein [Candidatus Omnitrophota bacterium]
MKNIKSLLKRRIIILDGATGTELQKRGLPQGACPELWCLKNPAILKQVHFDYAKAGADIVYACTFGANRLKLAQYNNSKVKEVNKKLVFLAKQAVNGRALVAGDIGPTGKFVEPFGSLEFEQAVEIFKEQAKALLSAGVDVFAVETMIDIQEARAALIAIREITDKFIMVTMTYEKGGRTLNGTDPVSALITLQSLGADAVGCNCSLGPEKMLEFIKMMKPYAKVPLVAKPNAGMPKLRGKNTFFDMPAKEFAVFSRKLALAGAGLIGGCCGTTPEHIKELRKKAVNIKLAKLSAKPVSILSSARGNFILTKKTSLVIIGECINPSGKKILAQQFRERKVTLARSLAKEQERAGAELLDVNVGAGGVDESKMLKEVVKALAVASPLPLVIDSSKIEAVEQALRIYPGRALINSISGESNKLDKLLLLAAKYGAMFVLLPLNEKGVPKNFKERKKIIEYIFKKAQNQGFTKEDIVVDALAMAVSVQSDAASEVLNAISWCSKVFKVNTTIGLSNISFGMPNRHIINSAFLTMAKARGLTTAIANPLDEKVINAARKKTLSPKNKDITNFIELFKAKPSSITTPEVVIGSLRDRIFGAVMDGSKEEISGLIKEALLSGIKADKLVQEIIILAINKVGELFDKKEYFLPQLIASAETAKIAFEELKPGLKKSGSKQVKKTVVFLATVQGDIHDIGKNIVGLMLENHGFSVIDLGKDVSASKIVSEIKKYKPGVVGLSALMTTTMINMKEVIDLAKKEKLNCHFIIGGAVVTKSYAQSIGAEYAANGVEAVKVVKKLDNVKSFMKN